jgi:hypothetical protein
MESLALLAFGVYIVFPIVIVLAVVVFIYKTIKRKDRR